jgi:hypothetical protein
MAAKVTGTAVRAVLVRGARQTAIPASALAAAASAPAPAAVSAAVQHHRECARNAATVSCTTLMEATATTAAMAATVTAVV